MKQVIYVDVDKFDKDALIAVASDIVIKLHRNGMKIHNIVDEIVCSNGKEYQDVINFGRLSEEKENFLTDKDFNGGDYDYDKNLDTVAIYKNAKDEDIVYLITDLINILRIRAYRDYEIIELVKDCNEVDYEENLDD